MAILPYANRADNDPEFNRAQRKIGNATGGILSLIGVLGFLFFAVLWLISSINPQSLSGIYFQFLIEAPLYAAYLTGIVFALTRFPKFPKVSTLLIVGIAILFFGRLGIQAAHTMNIQGVFSGSGRGYRENYEFIRHTINFLGAVFEAGGFICLLLAAFMQRSSDSVLPNASSNAIADAGPQ
ncbi:MAG: hypothetical protein ABL888_10385 [Pirellulaceae bacterium]